MELQGAFNTQLGCRRFQTAYMSLGWKCIYKTIEFILVRLHTKLVGWAECHRQLTLLASQVHYPQKLISTSSSTSPIPKICTTWGQRLGRVLQLSPRRFSLKSTTFESQFCLNQQDLTPCTASAISRSPFLWAGRCKKLSLPPIAALLETVLARWELSSRLSRQTLALRPLVALTKKAFSILKSLWPLSILIHCPHPNWIRFWTVIKIPNFWQKICL